jgi:hypothetical protein
MITVDRINAMIEVEQNKIDSIAAVYTETPNEGLAELHEGCVQRINKLMELLAAHEHLRTIEKK